MRKFILTAALAFAALGFATAGTAHAQVIVSGYSQGYYGGYSSGYIPTYYSPGYGSGVIVQSAGSSFYYNNTYPSYGNAYYPSYPVYSNYSPALDAYYSFYRRGAVGNTYNYGRRWR